MGSEDTAIIARPRTMASQDTVTFSRNHEGVDRTYGVVLPGGHKRRVMETPQNGARKRLRFSELAGPGVPSFSTVRHLALALDIEEATPRAMRELPALFAESAEDHPRRAAHSAPAASSGLSGLPTELLEGIKEHLRPADVVALALTCKKVRHDLDYALGDVMVPVARWAQGKRRHADHLRSELFDATERMDRDRVVVIEESCCATNATLSNKAHHTLACTTCLRAHPVNHFEPQANEDLATLPRYCRAALARLHVTPDWNFCFKDLLRLRRELLTSPDLKCSALFGSGGHFITNRSRNEGEVLKVDGCKVRAVYYNDNLVLNFNIMLTRRLKWAQVSPQKFRAVLAEGKDQAVCAHLTLGDLDLMSAYRVLRKGGNRASGRDRGRCKEPFCSTTWELNVEQENDDGSGMRLHKCWLEVQRTIKTSENPWDYRWFTIASGGEALEWGFFKGDFSHMGPHAEFKSPQKQWRRLKQHASSGG